MGEADYSFSEEKKRKPPARLSQRKGGREGETPCVRFAREERWGGGGEEREFMVAIASVEKRDGGRVATARLMKLSKKKGFSNVRVKKGEEKWGGGGEETF